MTSGGMEWLAPKGWGNPPTARLVRVQEVPDGPSDQRAVDDPRCEVQQQSAHAAISFRSRASVDREHPVALVILAQLCPFRSMVLSASFRSTSAGRPR